MEIIAGVLSLQTQHVTATNLCIPAIIGYRIRLPSPLPATLLLHARQLYIDSVHIEDVECSFQVTDYLRKVDPSTPHDPKSLVDAWIADAIYSRDFGELEITLPSTLPPSKDEYMLEIHYHLPSDGSVVYCIGQPGLDDHLYSRTGFMHTGEMGVGTGGSRTLFPTLDRQGVVFPFRVIIETKETHVAVATGKCIRERVEEGKTHLYEFASDADIEPNAVGFAVGQFTAIEHPTHPWITSYLLVSRNLVVDPTKLDRGVSYMLSKLGFPSPPPSNFGGTYAQVFVATERVSQTLLTYGSMSILSDAWLETTEANRWPDPADQYRAWHLYLVGFITQYIGWRAGSMADTWIPVGISMLIALQVLSALEGNQAYYSVFCAWQERVKNDTHPRPLAPPQEEFEPDKALFWAMEGVEWDSPWTARAGWVMYMLEQRVTEFVFMNVMTNLVANPSRRISEVAFLTLLKLKAGPDLSQDVNATFIQQWIRQTHIPRFTGKVEYHEKTRRVTVTLRQQPPPHGVELYSGAIRLRVVEKKGTWMYEKQIDAKEHVWVFECRTTQSKGKGGRRPRMEEEKSEQWNRAGEKTSDQLLAMASNTVTARYWTVSSVVQYVVLDPSFMWMMDVQWSQPTEYWLEWMHDPLLRDHTALQLLGIEQFGLAELTADPAIRSPASSYLGSIITDTTRDPAIRVQAIRTLSHLHERFAPANLRDHSRWVEQEFLYSAWKKLYCDASKQPQAFSTKQDEMGVRPVLLHALASLQARDKSVHVESMLAVLDSVSLLDAYEMDPYDKSELVGAVYESAAIMAVAVLGMETAPLTGKTTLSVESDVSLGEIVQGTRTLLDVDLVMPRIHGQHPATVRCLHALMRFEKAKMLPQDATCLDFYVEHPIWRADPQVRMTAFRFLYERLGVREWLGRLMADPCPTLKARLLKEQEGGGVKIGDAWSWLNEGTAYDARVRLYMFRMIVSQK